MKTYTEEEVRLLLAEQHRNTRHDAINEIVNVCNTYKLTVDTDAAVVDEGEANLLMDNGYMYVPADALIDIANQMSCAINNLEQRSPQNVLDIV